MGVGSRSEEEMGDCVLGDPLKSAFAPRLGQLSALAPCSSSCYYCRRASKSPHVCLVLPCQMTCLTGIVAVHIDDYGERLSRHPVMGQPPTTRS